jgi:hypothetical protein
MPEEVNRTTKNKKVKLPSGQTVLVPVITQISFIDPIRQYQEYQYTVDNSSQADRDTHVDQVTASDGSGTIDVERIDVWKTIDSIKQYQESQFKFDNVTGAHDTPPHFSAHTKTHLVKWGDSTKWVQSELIDEFSVIDPIQQYQEHQFNLTGNPDADQNGFAVTQADPSDSDITDSDTIDPPYRTDPYQNIVDFSDEASTGVAKFGGFAPAGGFMAPDSATVVFALDFVQVTAINATPGFPPGYYGQFVDETNGPLIGTWSPAQSLGSGGFSPGSVGTDSYSLDPGYNGAFPRSCSGAGLGLTVVAEQANASPPFDRKPIGPFSFNFGPMVFTAIGSNVGGPITPLNPHIIYTPTGGITATSVSGASFGGQVRMVGHKA